MNELKIILDTDLTCRAPRDDEYAGEQQGVVPGPKLFKERKTMLVLSRKKNESIVIDGNIEIEVLQVKGNSIRLGIKAPREVKVLRGELKPYGMASEDQTAETLAFAVRAG